MTIAFTLINIAYLPMAKTLADSFMAHNPDMPFYICLFDNKTDIQDPMFLEYNIYDKNNLNIEEYNDMRSRYDNFSMACALKPFFAEALIRDYNPENIVYLDADMMVFNSLEKLENILSDHDKSIILTGHNYKIIPSDTELSSNQRLRKYGLYNAGFFALKNNETGKDFINWWKRILSTKCIRNDSQGIYYDQTWLDLVPNYFGSQCLILRDLGYNVAYWNWNERLISKNSNNEIVINDEYNLIFYHFARYNYYNPEELKDYICFPNAVVEELFTNYKNKLHSNLIEEYQQPKIQKKQEDGFLDKFRLSIKYRLQNFASKL